MKLVFFKRKTLLILLFALLLGVLQVQPILAHGNLDQSSYVLGPPYYFEYSPYSIIGQEFRPTKSSIVGVDLLIHNIGGAGVKNIKLNLYKGALGANWQGSTNDDVYVPDGYSWVHVDFPAPIILVPGALYVINLGTPLDLNWVFNYGDSYSGGVAWVSFSQNQNIDFGFRTYYDPALEPPIAYAGPNQVVSDGDCSGAFVTLDGSGSSDPNDDPLTYTWSWSGGSATGESPTVMLPLGTTYVTLVVSDGQLSNSDTVRITVKEPTPPEITITSVTPEILWPPNHQMVDIEVEATWNDICDPNPLVSVIVSSSESVDNNGVGDGNTDTDWEIIDLTHFQLRAERDGVGSDRVYTIIYTVTDASGNLASASITVTVPHDYSE